MKRTILMVLATSLTLVVGTGAANASESASRKVATLYQQGLVAVKDGDAKLARECFQEVLRIQPSHANARYQLLSLSQKAPSMAARVRQKQLNPSEDSEGQF